MPVPTKQVMRHLLETDPNMRTFIEHVHDMPMAYDPNNRPSMNDSFICVELIDRHNGRPTRFPTTPSGFSQYLRCVEPEIFRGLTPQYLIDLARDVALHLQGRAHSWQQQLLEADRRLFDLEVNGSFSMDREDAERYIGMSTPERAHDTYEGSFDAERMPNTAQRDWIPDVVSGFGQEHQLGDVIHTYDWDDDDSMGAEYDTMVIKGSADG